VPRKILVTGGSAGAVDLVEVEADNELELQEVLRAIRNWFPAKTSGSPGICWWSDASLASRPVAYPPQVPNGPERLHSGSLAGRALINGMTDRFPNQPLRFQVL
jgi:hypothetical protein